MSESAPYSDFAASLRALLDERGEVSRSDLLRSFRKARPADIDHALHEIRAAEGLSVSVKRMAMGRPTTVYTLVHRVRGFQREQMVLRPDLQMEQARAIGEFAAWSAAVLQDARDPERTPRQREVSRIALDLAVHLLRASHRYARPVRAADVRALLPEAQEDGVWRSACKKLADLGVIELTERRDAPERATLCLKNPPPMPLHG